MLGCLLVLVVTVTLVVYIPQARKVDDVRTRTASEKTLLESNERRAAILPDVARRVQEMKALYQELDRRIPARTELGGFLREISGHLNSEKLSSQLIEPGNPSREDLFHTLPIIMRFQGSYLALGDFLKQIHALQRLARVQKLKIVRSSDEGVLDMELQLNIYFTDTDRKAR
jgi:Tfp pilus assembly protein PilO